MLRRPFTLAEWVSFILAASQVRDTVDRPLGEALLRVAEGDDSALTAVHDRLSVLEDFDGADRIRRLVLDP